MVTTGARSSQQKDPTSPPEVEYWVPFRRGDYQRGPAYTGTYGFDWVEWQRNSANNPSTAYDRLTSVMGKGIGNYVQCYDPGLPAAGQQPATPPHYAPVNTDRQRFENELHKGYDKIIVHGNDYYVPWLSLRPHQTVKLKLKVEFLNAEPVKTTNLFTVAAHPDYLITINGQTNNAPSPNAPASVPPVQATTSNSTRPAPSPPPTAPAPIQSPPVDQQVLDVTIECLRPSTATTLWVKDEKGYVVGQLNIAENLFVYELPLRVVYVLRGVPYDKKAPVGATPPRPLYAHPGSLATVQTLFEQLDFLTYLNTRTLNQALIMCVLQSPPPSTVPSQPSAPYQVLIDKAEWKAAGFLKGGVLQPQGLHEHCEKKANALYGSFNGLTLFVNELNIPPEGGGEIAASGAIVPVAARTLLVYRKGLEVGKKSTIAHELGHVLGLRHAFPMADENGLMRNNLDFVSIRASILVAQQAELAKLQQGATPITPTTVITPTIQAEQDAIKAKSNDVLLSQQLITRATVELATFTKNPFKFNQFSTENIMDYDPSETVDQRYSFWHWQWGVLQDDVAAHYGTKALAR